MGSAGRLPFRAALRAGTPDWRVALLGAIAWGTAMLASAAAGLGLDGWSSTDMARVLVLFFAGGGVAFPLALALFGILARWLGFRPTQRFAAAFLLLGIGTIATTAFGFSQVFRYYFATFHAPFGTRLWANQTVFTTAAGVYHFLVMGLRLFVPVGLPALLLAAFLLAGRPS
ncbi:hypothetical protein CSC94_13250 [Zhengella mangrovi]|uniref:Uncharacterized protein n=1 Tax=Zhengella mangrovi TaxID=1982044 RepID=A0A2G1QME3_9HYPH|nr:hypothetical protein [Zhengella mangrovi]PHP66644.1 hypothetical protein CSC94_13250 [Zhengella mangrovi]